MGVRNQGRKSLSSIILRQCGDFIRLYKRRTWVLVRLSPFGLSGLDIRPNLRIDRAGIKTIM